MASRRASKSWREARNDTRSSDPDHAAGAVLSGILANLCLALIVAFTALLYLVMALLPFWRESNTKPFDPQSPDDTFQQGEKK